MKTKIQQLKDSESELEVELEKDELKGYLEKAGKNLSGLFQVDGFRSGKVPLDILRQKIGDKKILEEALELAVTDSLAKALQNEGIKIISSSDLKIVKNTPEQLQYSVKILIFPEVQLGEYKNFGIAPRPVEVKDDEIEQVLNYLLKSRAGSKPDSKLDDEFAGSVGNFSSLEELRESLAEGLKLEKEQKERERVRLQILDKINETTKMKIPAKLVEQQLDEMVANFDRSLHQRGMELSLYLAQLKKTQADLRKEWSAQAEKQIRQALILKEIGRREEIKVDMVSEEGDALWRQKVFEFLEKVNN